MYGGEKTEKEKEQNVWRRKKYLLPRKRKEEENIWRRKIAYWEKKKKEMKEKKEDGEEKL